MLSKHRRLNLSTPTVVRSWGSHGDGDGQFRSPVCIAIGGNGDVYVVDSHLHSIKRFHADGTFVCKWGCFGVDDGKFNHVSSIAIGWSDGLDKSVLTEMCTIPELYAFPPGVLPICAVYVGEEYVYVTDTYNHRMQVFRYDGRFIRKWNMPDSAEPLSCAVNTHGVVYVKCKGHTCVHMFDCNGIFIRKWPVHVWAHGLSINAFGLIYMISTLDNHVVVYQLDGTLWDTWPGGPAHLYTRFVVASDRFAYVVRGIESALFDLKGKVIHGSWPPKEIGVCSDIACAPNGDIYMLDAAARKIIVVRH
jgi:hypothetical protein